MFKVINSWFFAFVWRIKSLTVENENKHEAAQVLFDVAMLNERSTTRSYFHSTLANASIECRSINGYDSQVVSVDVIIAHIVNQLRFSFVRLCHCRDSWHKTTNGAMQLRLQLKQNFIRNPLRSSGNSRDDDWFTWSDFLLLKRIWDSWLHQHDH